MGGWGGWGCLMPIFCPILVPLLCEFNKFEFSTGEGGMTPDLHHIPTPSIDP